MWRTRELRNYPGPRWCPSNGRDGRGRGRFLLFPSVACPARYLFTFFAADRRPRRRFSHLPVNLSPVQNKHRNEVFGTSGGRHRSERFSPVPEPELVSRERRGWVKNNRKLLQRYFFFSIPCMPSQVSEQGPHISSTSPCFSLVVFFRHVKLLYIYYIFILVIARSLKIFHVIIVPINNTGEIHYFVYKGFINRFGCVSGCRNSHNTHSRYSPVVNGTMPCDVVGNFP